MLEGAWELARSPGTETPSVSGIALEHDWAGQGLGVQDVPAPTKLPAQPAAFAAMVHTPVLSQQEPSQALARTRRG